MTEDRIYSIPLERIGDFSFDDAVADVFPDMIRRSVPGYASMLSMIAQCAERYIQPETNVYDLGCSLGAVTRVLLQHGPSDSCVIAVDNSSAMVSRMRDNFSDADGRGQTVRILEEDIRTTTVTNASLCVLNLTLQFLPPADRNQLIQNVFRGTLSGGALVLSEKICFEDDGQQQLMTELHHDFKRAHGYSDLEISQKRTAIENRLIPDTLQTHVDRLRSVGFRTVAPWFQCFNFASILAVK